MEHSLVFPDLPSMISKYFSGVRPPSPPSIVYYQFSTDGTRDGSGTTLNALSEEDVRVDEDDGQSR